MGVSGLWSLLEPTGHPVTLESLEGKRLAIDVSLWLHQAAEGYLRHEVASGSRSPHLALLIHRISKLLYYKVRPVFVFDGDRVPVFKQQLLRERRLKQHVEEITVSREQRRLLSNIVQQSQKESSPKKFSRKPTTEKEEMFVLPSTSTAPLPPKREELTDMGTFVESLSNDDRIRLLLDAREHARNERLTPTEIPQDSSDFSRFQMQRLLRRNKLTSQLDELCKEKERQYAKPFISGERSKVMFDSGNRGHMLTRHEDVEIVNEEKQERQRAIKDSLSWPAILQQMREEYDVEPSTSQVTPMEVDEDQSEEDDDFQEAILLSLCEESYRKRQSAPIPFSKASAIEDTTKIIAAKRAEMEAMEEDSQSDSDDSDEFVDVPDLSTSQTSFLSSFSKPSTSMSTSNSARNDDEGVYADCQQLLELCGIPFVLAPGEAEAQCAELEKLGLVDGIVTDDSDIWLFGGRTIYRNMFSQKKRVQKYLSSSVKEVLGLTRPEFIQLAMMSGGDYSRGFDGVGVITALELIAEFAEPPDSSSGFDLLVRIRQWLDAKKASNEKNFIESKTRIKLRRYLETNNNQDTIEKFPNQAVFEAYANPLVDSSRERFRWGVVSFDPMYNFIWEKLGWNEAKVDAATNRAFEKWSEFLKSDIRRFQTRITAFMEQPLEKMASEQRLTLSTRAQSALKKLMERKGFRLSEMILAKPQTKRKADPEEEYDSFNDSEDDWMFVEPSKDKVVIDNREFDISTVAKLQTALKDLKKDAAEPMTFRKKPKKRDPAKKKKKQMGEEDEDLKLSEESDA